MPHQSSRASRSLGTFAQLAITSLLIPLLPSASLGQASGGGVVHGGGKGGAAAIVTGPGTRSDGGVATKTMIGGPEPFTPPILPPFCTVSKDLLNPAQCAGSIACGPINIPCQDLDEGLAMAAAGAGLRNTDRASISILGVEDYAKPAFAFAVWAELAANGEPPKEQRDIIIDGVSLTGHLMLEALEPCWFGEAAGGTLRTYIADVTPILTTELNRDYEVEIPYVLLADESTPWPGPFDEEPPPEIDSDVLLLEGVSLMVFYTAPSLPPEATTYLHTSTEMLCHTQIFDLPLVPKLPTVVDELRHVMIVADNQARRQDGAVLAYRHWLTDDGALSNLAELGFSIIRGPLSLVDKHTLYGADGGEVAQLWDTATSRLAPGTAGISTGMGLYRLAFEAMLETPVSFEGEEPQYRFDCAVPLLIALSTR